MNTFRRSTFRWNDAARAAGAAALALAALAFVAGPQGPAPKTSEPPRDLPPFLELFNSGKEAPVLTQDVSFPSAGGRVRGYWARPDSRERLPAVLLVYDDERWTDWMKNNARQMAGIGYGVLTVDVHQRRLAAAKATDSPTAFTNEPALAELSAAVRWLRGRADVLPDQLGVVGWGWGGGQGLALAAASSLQACVFCDSPIPDEPSMVLGLRRTPLLGIFGAEETAAVKALPAFRKALIAAGIAVRFSLADRTGAGFMGPPGQKAYDQQAAEKVWVEIYEFLGKYVEDAHRSTAGADPVTEAGSPLKALASIADIMRAVNDPAGIRGKISRSLEQEPGNARQWERIRADAALIAETGTWLQLRIPPKGRRDHWNEQAQAFTTAATAIVTAADRHDYPGARRVLQQLAERCAACHEQHR